MVFSFFKKPPEKMPERQAARPRAPAVRLPEVAPPTQPVEEVVPLSEPLPDLEFSLDDPVPPGKLAKPAVEDFDDGLDSDFTESSVMAIDVAHDQDPVQADIEQVVVLFANGQEAAARSLLETYVRSYPGSEGIRFWRLLFDLLQITGEQQEFEKLGVEFAETCETSPPTWQDRQPVMTRVEAGVRVVTLQGVLTSESGLVLDQLVVALETKQPLRLDCGKLAGCDDEVAGELATLLMRARRSGVALTLDGADGFLARLNDRLPVGVATHAPAWQLLLELLQRLGTQEAFEERAVDYAVTFELSPPSWEAAPAGKAGAVGSPVAPARVDDAHYLSGDIRGARFDDLLEVLERHEQPVLDFSAVSRLDFFSAGQLVNRLAPFKAAGREIIIRSPNHLVAELMAVVGLNRQARIIVPKS